MVQSLITVGFGILASALFAVLVGNRIAVKVDTVKKARELDLGALEELYSLYGRFFAVWKAWNTPAAKPNQADLFREAAASEGRLESLFVRVACQRRLSEEDTDTLGKYRQAYQQLRNAIRDGKPLDWSSSDNPRYEAFKNLTAQFAVVLQPQVAGIHAPRRPSPEEAANALMRITENAYESTWFDTARMDGQSQAVRGGLGESRQLRR